MSHWIEKEEERLENLLEAGDITQEEFWEEIRELHRNAVQAAEDAAEEAYWNALGGRW